MRLSIVITTEHVDEVAELISDDELVVVIAHVWCSAMLCYPPHIHTANLAVLPARRYLVALPAHSGGSTRTLVVVETASVRFTT